jgi:hypothetical protein
MHMESHKLFYCGKEKGTGEFGVPFVVEGSMKWSVLDFEAVDERMCIVRINKVSRPKFYKCTSCYRGKG